MADRAGKPDGSRHLMREAHGVERDAIFNAFFSALRR
jgi:hypothetical protein